MSITAASEATEHESGIGAIVRPIAWRDDRNRGNNNQSNDNGAQVTDETVMEEANRFYDSFIPQEGVDYKWVNIYASESWKEQLSIYQKLEEKAGSVITWLSSGTGLFAVATIAAISKGDISLWVALGAVLPFAAGLFAVFTAIQARMATSLSYWPPAIQDATGWAEMGTMGQAAMLVELNRALKLLMLKTRRRSRMINTALYASFVSVASMSLPLAIALWHMPTISPQQTKITTITATIPIEPEATKSKPQP